MSHHSMHSAPPYTYRDYCTWDDAERWELLDGIPYLMASPTPEHQSILLNIATAFHAALQGTDCIPFVSPLDVTFEASDDTRTVVQPDVFVMCGTFGHDSRIVGVPTLVVEILSPSTAAHDTIRKLNLYQQMGVLEYWIVEPDTQLVNQYRYDGTLLRWLRAIPMGEAITSDVLPKLTANTRVFFS